MTAPKSLALFPSNSCLQEIGELEKICVQEKIKAKIFSCSSGNYMHQKSFMWIIYSLSFKIVYVVQVHGTFYVTGFCSYVNDNNQYFSNLKKDLSRYLCLMNI